MRAFLAPFIFIAIKNNDIYFIIALAIAGMLTDFLDGLLARRLKAISGAGKILDPLADKLCVASAAIALTLYADMPLLLTIVIIARDFFIAIFGLAVIRSSKHIPVSNFLGKTTVLILALTLLVYIFRLKPVYDFAYAIALIFIALSSINYISLAYRYILTKSLNNKLI